MDTFKLDLSKLTPVEEADRIKGNWYVVSDSLKDYGTIRQWHCKNNAIDGGGGIGIYWKHWLQIPPNLPGFPKAELPDEFELDYHEWDVDKPQFRSPKMTIKIKRKPTLPELTIPSGTVEEQIEATKKILAELETKAGGSR